MQPPAERWLALAGAHNYSLKKLGEKIAAKMKEAGLPAIAEENLELAAKCAYEGSKEWFAESAAETETKIDDVVASFSSFADQYVIPQIAAIDLDKDGK